MTNLDMRMVYENAKKLLNKSFPNLSRDIADVCKLTQSNYRLEQGLVANQNTYTFPVLTNDPLFSNTEKRLRMQDSAVIYSVAVLLGLPSSATDVAFPLLTYNSPALIGANAAAYYALWNGSNLGITVNNDVLIPDNWDVWRHYYAPETQQTAALGAGSPQDENRGSWDGFYPMEPNIVMVGSKGYVFKITLAAGLTAVNEFSRIVIMLRSITAQNSTVVS